MADIKGQDFIESSRDFTDCEFIDKLDCSRFFLNNLYNEEIEILNNIQINIDLLKEKINELITSNTKSISQSNAELFTPLYVKENNNYTLRNSEIDQCKYKLGQLEEDFIYHMNRKKEFENLKEVLSTLNEKNTYTSDNLEHSSSNGYLIKEDIHHLNSSHLNEINSEFGINALESYENERKRIARDLHDSTVQNLTNLMYKTELCTKLIDIDPVRAKLELQTMIRTIKGTISEMRNIIYDLRPMSLDDLGLMSTIEKFINEKKSNHEIDIDFHVNEMKCDVLPIVNLTIFRIVQEATNNAIKHGKASKIDIDLLYGETSITLTISDNGIGFNKSAHKEDEQDNSGFGLSIMKERVLLLSGQFNIESSFNKGTIIKVVVPIRTYTGDK